MPSAPLPINEAERLAALRSYKVLDTACETTFDNMAELAAKLTGSPIALVSLVDADRQWFKARHGLEAAETPRDLAFCAHAILTPDQLLEVPDTHRDPRFADNSFVTQEPHIRFYAGVPLVNPEGFALGTLCIIDGRPRELSADQKDILQKLADAVSTTLELRRAMLQVQHLALTDALTGIANRPAFLDTLDRSIALQKRHGGRFALLFLDLDGFKRVNDVWSHATGDHVLREIASTVTASLRREDVAARLGGDEFAVLLQGGDVDGATVAERIRLQVKARMDLGGWPVTASVGVVSFCTPPDDVAEALAAADELMYAAKLAGKNRITYREYKRASFSDTAASLRHCDTMV